MKVCPTEIVQRECDGPIWYMEAKDRRNKTVPLSIKTGCESQTVNKCSGVPIVMSGLLWLLVIFEGQSDSGSLERLTVTTISLLSTGGFSWDDTSSSTGTNREIEDMQYR